MRPPNWESVDEWSGWFEQVAERRRGGPGSVAVAGGGHACAAEGLSLIHILQRVAAALGASQVVHWPEVDRARAAAFLITNAEGATLHLPDLKTRAHDFEPLSRDRFLAGALLPAAWVVQAQRCLLYTSRTHRPGGRSRHQPPRRLARAPGHHLNTRSSPGDLLMQRRQFLSRTAVAIGCVESASSPAAMASRR